jgi:hypothetical protein
MMEIQLFREIKQPQKFKKFPDILIFCCLILMSETLKTFEK